MRNTLISLLLILSYAAAGQTPGFVIERSPDGKYLRIQNKVMFSSSKGAARDLTIYNFETDTQETIKQMSAYGGYSPNHTYLAYSKHAKDRNKHVYKNELIGLNTGRKSSFSDDHLVLKVFDNGKILSTKPSFNKYGNIKSQSGLYVLDPKSGKKTTVLGKKEDLKNYLRFNHVFTDDFMYSVKLNSTLDVYNLITGEKESYSVTWPDMGFLGTRRVIEASEEGAVLRATVTKDGKRLWRDFFYNTSSERMIAISDDTKSTLASTYELIDGKLYGINPTEKVIKRFRIEPDGLVEGASWTFNAVDYRRDVKEYEFALASEGRLAVVHFKDGLMQVIDLTNDSPIKEVSLFRVKPIATVAASKPKATSRPQKKLYNNLFLNSFDPLPMPYRLDYNTVRGREVTRPNGQAVSAIGLLGNTNDGSLMVLMMRRYNAQGAEIIRFSVAVYDEQAKLKSEKEVGFTTKDRSGVPNKVDFVINRSGQGVVFKVDQKQGKASRKYQVIINANGTITRTQ